MAPLAVTHPHLVARNPPTDGGLVALGMVGVAIGVVTGILLILGFLAALVYESEHYYTGRRDSLMTVYKFSWNPLVLAFSFPFHVYRFCIWIGKSCATCFQKKKAPVSHVDIELGPQVVAPAPDEPVERVDSASTSKEDSASTSKADSATTSKVDPTSTSKATTTSSH